MDSRLHPCLAQCQLGAPSGGMAGSFQLYHGLGCVPGDPKIPGETRQTGRDDERVTQTTGTVPSPCPVAQQLPEHSPAATWRPRPSLHQHSDTGGTVAASQKPPPIPTAPADPTGELPTPPKKTESLGLSKLSLFQMLKDEFFVLSALINQPKYSFLKNPTHSEPLYNSRSPPSPAATPPPIAII